MHDRKYEAPEFPPSPQATVPASWHRLPDGDAVAEMAWNHHAQVLVDYGWRVQFTVVGPGTYWAPLAGDAS